MSYYVVINLADRDGMGAISKLVEGVGNKRSRSGISKLLKGQNLTERVDAFDMLDDFVAGNLQRNDPRLQALRTQCARSKKIYLATHGTPTDVDHAFANAAGGQPLCTAKQMGDFMLMAMPDRETEYNLALVMCYGARTLNFRATNLDHQGMIPIHDLRSSFAYKLFRRLVAGRKVRMTGRTGAVAFDANTGVSTVEQEVSVDARIDKEAFLRQAHILPATNANRARELQAAQAGNASYDRFQQMSRDYRAQPGRAAHTGQQQDIKAYQEIMRRKQAFVDIMEANNDRTKYGKLVYSYRSGHLKVINKYGNGGQPIALYDGLLL